MSEKEGRAAQNQHHKLNALSKAKLFTLVANPSLRNEDVNRRMIEEEGVSLSSSYISEVRHKTDALQLMGYTKQLEKVLLRKARIYSDSLEIMDCATRALLRYIKKQENDDLSKDDIRQVLYIVETVSRIYALFEANKTHSINIQHNIEQYKKEE